MVFCYWPVGAWLKVGGLAAVVPLEFYPKKEGGWFVADAIGDKWNQTEDGIVYKKLGKSEGEQGCQQVCV